MTMNLSERPLTLRQGVLIASRALCVLCLFNALVNASYLPSYLASPWHYWHELPIRGIEDSYLLGIYVRQIAVGVIRLGVELLFAGLFYRCGPGVVRFLLGGDDESETDELR